MAKLASFVIVFFVWSSLLAPLTSGEDDNLEVHVFWSIWCKNELELAINDIVQRMKGTLLHPNYQHEQDKQMDVSKFHFAKVQQIISVLEQSKSQETKNCELQNIDSQLLNSPVLENPGFCLLSFKYLQLKAISEVYGHTLFSYPTQQKSIFKAIFKALKNDYSRLKNVFFGTDEFPSALKISSWNIYFFTDTEDVVTHALGNLIELRKTQIKVLKKKLIESLERKVINHLNLHFPIQKNNLEAFFSDWKWHIYTQEEFFAYEIIEAPMGKRYIELTQKWSHIWSICLAKNHDQMIEFILEKFDELKDRELWYIAKELQNVLDFFENNRHGIIISHVKEILSKYSKEKLAKEYKVTKYVQKITESSIYHAQILKIMHTVQRVDTKIMLLYAEQGIKILESNLDASMGSKNYHMEKINRELMIPWKEIIQQLNVDLETSNLDNFPDINNIRILISILFTQKDEFEYTFRPKLERFQYCPTIKDELPRSEKLNFGRDMIALYINSKIEQNELDLNTQNLEIIYNVLTEYFGKTTGNFEYLNSWDKKNFDFGCDEVVAGILEGLLEFCKEFLISDQNIPNQVTVHTNQQSLNDENQDGVSYDFIDEEMPFESADYWQRVFN